MRDILSAMLGLNFGRGSFKRVAVVDIGSASAAIGILDLKDNGKSTLVAAHRSFIPYEKRSKAQFAARVGESIQEASKKIADILKTKPEKSQAPVTDLFAFFRAPWVDARVTKLSNVFEAEKRITKDDIDEMANKSVSKAEQLLETIVLRVEVNGYATPDAVGKMGKSLSLFALTSTVDAELQRSTQENLEKIYPHIIPSWRSHTRALISSIREEPARPRDLVIVDISSEGTSFLIMRDGILDSQATFEFGVHAILEKLAPKALPEETLGLVSMLEREQCSGDACAELKANMDRVEQEMVRAFGEQLAALAGKNRLPPELLLFVHPNMQSWLARFFSRIDFSQFTIPLQPFSVHELSSHDMQSWITIESSMPDMSLLLAASLVHIENSYKK